MTVAEAYAAGVAEGERYGEQDVAESGSTSYWHAEFQAHADSARDRGERARCLGVLRGYRSVTRRLLGGRWGT